MELTLPKGLIPDLPDPTRGSDNSQFAILIYMYKLSVPKLCGFYKACSVLTDISQYGVIIKMVFIEIVSVVNSMCLDIGV